MRDILVILICFTGWFYTVKTPYIGILLWSWLSYMSPQRLCFGFAHGAPLELITALVLISSMLISKEEKKFPLNALTVIWMMFILFMGLTTYFAYFPVQAALQYTQVIKIQLLVFLTLILINDWDKLNKLIWLIVVSIGFYSVKGGVFLLMTGGAFTIWGAPGTVIEDNAGLVVAVTMTIPLMVYLYQIHSDKWIKLGLLVAILLSLVAVVGAAAQSRALIPAVIAIGTFFWTRSKHKWQWLLFIAIGFYLILSSLEYPIDRVINSDVSMGRVNAWHYAYNSSKDNLLGMGFDSWSPETFALYAPNPGDVNTAQSIYFAVLGDHGWIGLGLFLLILCIAWYTLKKTIQRTTKDKNLQKFHSLAKNLQIGFIVFFVGGAFVNFSYFGLPWHLIAIVIILSQIVAKLPVKDTTRPVTVKTRPVTEVKLYPDLNVRKSYKSYSLELFSDEIPLAFSEDIPDFIWRDICDSNENLDPQKTWKISEESERAFWDWCDSKGYFMNEIGTPKEILMKFKEWSDLYKYL